MVEVYPAAGFISNLTFVKVLANVRDLNDTADRNPKFNHCNWQGALWDGRY